MPKIRVLVVDDSATMRGLITAALNRDSEIEVVGAAGDPFEARGMIKALNPDVVTLDIEMPNMNGIEFLEKIMRLRPMPVVMVSSLTQAGAEMTLRALELGAVDCVGKPTTATGTAEALAEVAEKVKTAARASVRTKADAAPAPVRRGAYVPTGDVVAIGSSTGGVEALLSILTQFPETCPPTVITQHMPATFTASFAARLDRASGAKVQEATDGALLEVGKVYVAPGGATHLEVVRSAGLRCRLTAGDPVSGHRPSVDVLFRSVAQAVGDKAVGAILTGMGRDGAQGLLQMRQAGARTVGQDEASCVVYGMPRAAFELGAVEKQVSLSSIGQSILDLASARR
ncbi:chemotaxis response regulator protein-glutamate methylesterase [Caulobacter sp. D4A]|uniref:protein-glutamate methylesterase/protein-glutamine glutaminase n=1 Tax=unclassified Caulobacter TaxID=2648921 RepID=UPI000D731041|nr:MULTISPECIES: chemotaxis response regulator protein-glutamate methylesterase [unclassified Caulobacter]PXA91296.1 chemotaxis response regulator protein-glutamate methylesterase [Caulobacter sp. D4A]PXA93291.1 chemotaxis response regulator protein-glutamate methylesterase [Caulobacter sp. D5]